MKIFTALPVLSALALSAHAWCMNGHDKDAIKMGDLVDQCGNSVASGDVFVLYDERYRNYLGLGDKDWLTLTQSSPAGFFWQTSPSNPSSIQYLKSTGGSNCAVQNKAWLGHSGRYMAPDNCRGGGFIEFRKWEDGQCASQHGCYQIGLLTGDQPVNGAIANYDSYGYVNLVGANCEDKTFKWVVKKIKKSSGWSGTYSVNDIVNC